MGLLEKHNPNFFWQIKTDELDEQCREAIASGNTDAIQNTFFPRIDNAIKSIHGLTGTRELKKYIQEFNNPIVNQYVLDNFDKI